MTERLRLLRLAARDVDPMSWFTGPYLPLVMGALVAAYGLLSIVVTWSERWPLQLLGWALLICACLVVQLLVSVRNRYTWQLGAAAVGIGLAGIVASAWGETAASFDLETWWAPTGFALVVACLAPYLSALRLFAWGLVGLLSATGAAFWIVWPLVDEWGPVSTGVIIWMPIAVAVAGSTAFAYTVVHEMLPIVDNRTREFVTEGAAASPEAEAAERALLARLTARATPFIRTIAERGSVSADDRGVAAELARQLRDVLVSRSSLAWLGLDADETRVVVVDPEGRADALRPAQRAAIRDLLRAVLDDPATIAATISIELRGHDDGSTAVAVTLDMDLPEGRRVRHIAPHFFNLRGEMDRVQVSRDGISFRVPPAD